MKKLLLGLTILLLTLPISGCFKRDDLDDVVIYTTVYPIEYLTDTLYGHNSKVLSIYPDGVNVNEYTLTEKQINDYSKASIFVYNGLSDEKNIAKKFIDKNRNIRIIDAASAFKYEYDIPELWLSPNNYLMLATTIHDNLQEFITNKIIKDELELNYIEKLERPLSLMDAELRRIGTESRKENKNVIVVDDILFKFFENYGFKVIYLAEEENLKSVQNSFKNKTFTYILVRDDKDLSEIAEDLVSDYNAEVVEYKIMSNIDDDERRDRETYFSLMNLNMETIKRITIGS